MQGLLPHIRACSHTSQWCLLLIINKSEACMTQSRYRRKPERRKTLLISKNFISRVDFFAEEETRTERIFDDFSVVGVSANLRVRPRVTEWRAHFLGLWPFGLNISGERMKQETEGETKNDKNGQLRRILRLVSLQVSRTRSSRMQESVVCKALYCFVGWQTWKKISPIIMCQKTANSQVWKKIMRIYDTEYKWSWCC